MLQSEKWELLKQEILNKIDIIDKETRYSTLEPNWWVEMMNIQRHILNAKIKVNVPEDFDWH